jgi:uncharacterized protein with FMN-binding domain
MKIAMRIISAVFIFGIIAFVFSSIGLNDIKKIYINDINISRLEDGVYTGAFHKARWKYDVEVTIENQQIKYIRFTTEIKDKTRREIASKVLTQIIEKQSLNIDAVSGASVDTRAIRKAVDNALVKGNMLIK